MPTSKPSYNECATHRKVVHGRHQAAAGSSTLSIADLTYAARPCGEEIRSWLAVGRSVSKSFKGLVDHPGRPQQALKDREEVFPELVCLLPKPHPGSEDAGCVDRAAPAAPALLLLLLLIVTLPHDESAPSAT